MKSDALPLQTDFGAVRSASPADAERVVPMVENLARYHGDTPTITGDDLIRDISGASPWLHVLVAEMKGELVGYAALCGLPCSA